MTGIRRQISDLFGVLISPNEWDEVFESLDRENRINNKMIVKVLLIILKWMEARENEQ